MNDMSLRTSEAVSLFNGTLIVGNHDTITLFGSQPQNSLKDYSRRLTTLLLKETEEIDMAISDVIKEIEQFEQKANKTKTSFLNKRYRHKAIQKEYYKVISYIENMTLFFKLQQAHLIKEIKLLEKLSDAISLCAKELEHCIDTGKSVLIDRSPSQKKSGCSPPDMTIGSDLEMWYSRLEKRIEDLSISHTISLQSKAQIELLYNNDLTLLDRIANAISNTLPIWQNQVAIMLGVELLEARLTAQKKAESASFSSGHSHIKNGLKGVQPLANTEKFLELNQFLTTTLYEMSELEKNDLELREGFAKATQHTERG